MPNRHDRRAARKKQQDDFYTNYVRHLPTVEIDAPLERGKVYHTVCCHDDWCTIYDDGGICNCNVVVTRHVEPRRA
jgi:hypothetical protein